MSERDPRSEDESTDDRQRLFDLVRYCRHKLFEEGLISQDEFTRILIDGSSGATDEGSVKRLESYDQMRARLKWMYQNFYGAESEEQFDALREAIDERRAKSLCDVYHSVMPEPCDSH